MTAYRPRLEVLSRLPEYDEGLPPLLFVHGLGHGAWCWDEHWMPAAAAAGFPAYAVSLRGHAGSGGRERLRWSRLGDYADDVVRAVATLPRSPVLVGHSMGGLVVQQVLARYPARAGVLVAPVPAEPAVGAAMRIAGQHPGDLARMLTGRSLPMRPEYLFHGLDAATAASLAGRCGPESALAQHQLLLHRPPGPPKNGAPVLVLAAPEDRLVPMGGIRRTARRYGTAVVEFPGMGHDLMLDAGWRRPLETLLDWVRQAVVTPGRMPRRTP
jgi:pimeloyl-ACP methyl ester carboxylesterase